MVKFLWQHCRNIIKLLESNNLKVTCDQLLQYRPMSSKGNAFLPPSRVKGMKVLDRQQFNKTIIVPGLYLPLKSIKDAQKSLKNYLLKLQNFRPITVPSEDFIKSIKEKGIHASTEEGKVAILDPQKIENYKDLEESDRNTFEKLGINENYLSTTELLLTYDNYKADEILRAVIPDEFDSVSGYSLIGHIIHLNMREHLSDYKSLVGMVLLDKVKPARTVVNKLDIIDSTYRNFQMELLCGEDNMIAKVLENKCKFEFDFSKVYWNPRLCTEHERIVESLKKEDILYDVFCGVGPFSIPAAKKGCTVLANDLNPDSINWLRSNIKLNKIGENISVFNKDGSEFIKEDIKRHLMSLNKNECGTVNIVMNLPALATTFLPCFQQMFSADEISELDSLPVPKVILYCFVKGVCDASEVGLQQVSEVLGIDLKKEDKEVLEIFFVRDVAPNKKMMRISLLLTRRIISSRKRPIEELNNDNESLSKKACT